MKRWCAPLAIVLLTTGHGEAWADPPEQDQPKQDQPKQDQPKQDQPVVKAPSPLPDGRGTEPKQDPPKQVVPKDRSGGSPRRALPDYDGRGGEPTTAGDVALWVPRIALSPLYFTSEYLVRRPLGALIAGAERAGLPSTLYNFFTFGPEHKAGFFPIGFFDFGINPSVGIYVFWNDAFFKRNNFHFHATTWTSEWIAGTISDTIQFNEKDSLTLKAAGIRRPDHAFFGTGPHSLQTNRSRYAKDQIDVSALIDLHLYRAIRVEAGIGMRTVEIGHGHYGGDPSLEQGVAAGYFAVPYGFERGYTMQYNHVLAALDTRKPKPAPGSGIRIELSADQGNDVRRTPGGGWIRYGGTIGGFVDLNERGRVLSLSLATQFADPLGSAPIPFPELVSLGGTGPMRGYLPGRLLDRSAAVLTARYKWPIWIWLDGSMQAAVGNVFGEHLRDFKPSLLRFSGAIGVESTSSPDSSFEVLLGVGSETFANGGQINSVRVLFGSNRGF